jgi:hypothetical protein
MTVSALYGPVDPVSTWNESSFARFSLESETDKLCIGPIPVADGAKSYTFGVRRQ